MNKWVRDKKEKGMKVKAGQGRILIRVKKD